MTSEIIWSLVAISAAIAASIAAHFAQRACSNAEAALSVATKSASEAIRLASLAIERVASSRASRLADSSMASQTRKNITLSDGAMCAPGSTIRAFSSPSSANSERHIDCLSSAVAIGSPNAVLSGAATEVKPRTRRVAASASNTRLGTTYPQEKSDERTTG